MKKNNLALITLTSLNTLEKLHLLYNMKITTYLYQTICKINQEKKNTIFC